MLSELYIENVAVIEKVTLTLGAGLNVLTGETGAGKSILIDAINAILGMRTSRDLIRSGERSARVTALFTGVSKHTADRLSALGAELDEEGGVLLQRTLSLDGKSVCRINGQPVTAGLLRDVGVLLINIHGQHDNQALLSPEAHVGYLDAYGKLEAHVAAYQAAYQNWKSLRAELAQNRTDEADRLRKIDLLTYQIGEIDAAALEIGEEEELSLRRTQILSAEKIASALQEADRFLGGDDEILTGAEETTGRAASALSDIAPLFPEAQTLYTRLEGLSYELAECASGVRELLEGMAFEPSEISEIEARLDRIYRLSLKYGKGVGEILAFQAAARDELNMLMNSEQNRARLEEQTRGAEERVRSLGNALLDERKMTAERFTKALQKELQFLDMPGVRFEVEQKETEPTSRGLDAIQFLISTNPGEPPKPLAKIASGGELSRMMLALKAVFARIDELDTLIFDEIDTGISGGAAQKVGLKMKEVSRARQIICVTHLAQIACYADEHFIIEKTSGKDRTFTHVSPLDREGRVGELARIMGGAQSQAMRLGAEELLQQAGMIE